MYHVFNRTIAHAEAFTSKRELHRVLELVNYYRFPQHKSYSRFKSIFNIDGKNHYLKNIWLHDPLVEIHAFTIMPNHFHFLLKQICDKGISTFISNLQNGYAKYFNKKDDRNGSLFQKPFKAKRIASDELLLHISRYIHLNMVTSYMITYDKLEESEWTSYGSYTDKRKVHFINTDFILKVAGSKKIYEKFVKDQIDYQRKLGMIKKYILE